MAYIHIKFRKEPLYVIDEKAKAIEKIYMDSSVSRATGISIGSDWTGELGSISGIDFKHEKSATERGSEKPHWIIINESRGQAWKQSYHSYEAAKAEFDFQISSLAKEETHGWKIEERGRSSYKRPDITIAEMDEIESIKKDIRAKFAVPS